MSAASLTQTQKLLLTWGVGLLAMATIVVPWRARIHLPSTDPSYFAGYAPITEDGSRPTPELLRSISDQLGYEVTPGEITLAIDHQRLGLGLVTIGLLTALAVGLMGSENPRAKNSEPGTDS
jgi:hypothetical protein